MELNDRQTKIIEIVKNSAPITSEQIAEKLKLTRATLRPDLAILTMSGFLEARPRVGYFYTGQTLQSLFSEQIEKFKVRDFLSCPAVVKESASAYDAVCEMFRQDVGSLFVVNGKGFLAGVLSRKDLLRAAIGTQNMNQVPVSVIMSRMPNIASCHAEDPIISVAELIIEKQVDAVPVVCERDGGLEVIGRITKTNITRVFVQLARGTANEN